MEILLFGQTEKSFPSKHPSEGSQERKERYVGTTDWLGYADLPVLDRVSCHRRIAGSGDLAVY